jgi:hypothetical protein
MQVGLRRDHHGGVLYNRLGTDRKMQDLRKLDSVETIMVVSSTTILEQTARCFIQNSHLLVAALRTAAPPLYFCVTLASSLLPLPFPALLLVGSCVAHSCSYSFLLLLLASPLQPLLIPAQLLVGCCITRRSFSSLLLCSTCFSLATFAVPRFVVGWLLHCGLLLLLFNFAVAWFPLLNIRTSFEINVKVIYDLWVSWDNSLVFPILHCRQFCPQLWIQ